MDETTGLRCAAVAVVEEAEVDLHGGSLGLAAGGR